MNYQMKIISGLLLLVVFAGCNKNESKVNAPTSTKVTCEGFAEEVGKPVSYPDSNAPEGKKFVNDLTEYKTASGFKMRLPPFVGGLADPNARCEAESGRFEFFWVDGKLVPYFDLKTGERVPKGVMIQYFVTFSPPSEILVEKYGESIFLPPNNKWMLEGAFPIVGNEKIWVLPFAEYATPEHMPKNRNDKTLWGPNILLTEVRSAFGTSARFSCGELIYKDVSKGIAVNLGPRFTTDPNSTKCMAGLTFARNAGGRIDIFDPNFLADGAQITNAVIQELNSYIVRD